MPNVVGDTQAVADFGDHGRRLGTRHGNDSIEQHGNLGRCGKRESGGGHGREYRVCSESGYLKRTGEGFSAECSRRYASGGNNRDHWSGLVLGTVTTPTSSTVAAGNVISESPTAGTSVNVGSAVNIVVSTGPAKVSVPNVVGDTQAAATTAITRSGLSAGHGDNGIEQHSRVGNVISESPAAGTSVNVGSRR